MKLNNLVFSLIANYAAAISVPENARSVGLEARYIGELCTAPIVCFLSLIIPCLSFFTILEGDKGKTKFNEMKLGNVVFMLTSLLKDGVDFVGTCEYTSWCSGRQGTSVANHCPGPNDVQCCIDPACNSGATGYCEITSAGCAGGIFVEYVAVLSFYAIALLDIASKECEQ